MYDVGLLGCQSCSPIWAYKFRCRTSCKLPKKMYVYFTMYFIRNDNVIMEPRSINRGAPSVLQGYYFFAEEPLVVSPGARTLAFCPADGAKAWRPWETKGSQDGKPCGPWSGCVGATQPWHADQRSSEPQDCSACGLQRTMVKSD